MTKEEVVLYLANIVLVSSVDGVFNPEEAKTIEFIRREIGASEIELKKALSTVGQGEHQITPVGRISDKVRNLEDMVFVSLSDGEFSKSEKPEVISFAKAIKMTQNQLNEILSESKLRIKLQEAKATCSSCGKKIPPESKFCPKCGVSLGSSAPS